MPDGSDMGRERSGAEKLDQEAQVEASQEQSEDPEENRRKQEEVEEARRETATLKVRSGEEDVKRLKDLGSSQLAQKEGINIRRTIETAEEKLEALKYELEQGEIESADGDGPSRDHGMPEQGTDDDLESLKNDPESIKNDPEALQSFQDMAQEYFPGYDGGSLAVWKSMLEAFNDDPGSRGEAYLLMVPKGSEKIKDAEKRLAGVFENFINNFENRMAEEVRKTKDFEELDGVIDKFGFAVDAKNRKIYEKEKIKGRIDSFRQGEGSVDEVPEVASIRFQVSYLKQLEAEKKGPNPEAEKPKRPKGSETDPLFPGKKEETQG